MNILKPVSTIMSTDLKTVDSSHTLMDVKDIFDHHHHRHIPVLDNGKLVGIISLTDFLRISYGASLTDEGEEEINELIYKAHKIGQVMSEKPVTLSVNDTIKRAAEIFSQNLFHAIPIVDKGKLVGLVTSTDIIKFLIKEAEK